MDYIKVLNEQLNKAVPGLKQLDAYYLGEQPAAFLSHKAREALDNGLTSLAVNFPRLVVSSLSERLNITGFKFDDADKTDGDMWRTWKRNRMIEASAQAHLDALIYGRSYVVVWGNGSPVITVESPLQVTTITDPLTRRVVAGFKRWADHDGNGHGVLYEADKITRLRCGRLQEAGAELFPAYGWETVEVINNPLGVVPIVPIVNRGRLLESNGVSEMRDILGLSDALNKLMSDALVSSEFFARPRRWVTGLEIVEDEEGNVVDPFPNEAGKLWQSESPETKFGQFDAARLDGYGDLTAVVTQQIGALTGLPPHYLGLHGDQPASADAIRSAEASLVARCYELQRTFGRAWADVAALVRAVETGADPLAVDASTIWATPETRTPAQSADAAGKLHAIGVPLRVLLSDVLGWSPEQVEEAMRAHAEQSGQLPPPVAQVDKDGGEWWQQ